MEREEKVRRAFHAAGEILSDPDRHGIGMPDYTNPNHEDRLCLVLTVSRCCTRVGLDFLCDRVFEDLGKVLGIERDELPVDVWEGPGTTTESRLEIARKLREY